VDYLIKRKELEQRIAIKQADDVTFFVGKTFNQE
jgi:hypothetical protein